MTDSATQPPAPSTAVVPTPAVAPTPATKAPAATKVAKTGTPRTGTVVRSKPAPDTRTPAEIEADLVATRARLAGRIDEVTAYVAPKAVARRQVEKVKGVFVDEFGGIRPERVAIAAAVGALVVGLLVRRARRR